MKSTDTSNCRSLEAANRTAPPLPPPSPMDDQLLLRYSRQHPERVLHYVNRSALGLEAQYLQAPLTPQADLMISSAMGLQYRLANQGHALALEAPNLTAWPANSRWRNELYAMSFEPIVMVARRDALKRLADLDGLRNPLDVLRSHRDFWHLLEMRRCA